MCARCTETLPRDGIMLIARRLAERGVRYVQCYHGGGQPWDSHHGSNHPENHKKLSRESDKPIAALIDRL